MSKLSVLVGKAKIYTIGELQLELKPRTMSDIDLIMDISNDAKKGEAMKELVKRTLKEAVPDATDEEIYAIGFKYFREISDAIIDVNGLKADVQ